MYTDIAKKKVIELIGLEKFLGPFKGVVKDYAEGFASIIG